MKLEEFKNQVAAIKEEANLKIRELHKEYAATLRICELGDIIQSGSIILKVTAFRTYFRLSDYSIPMYYGTQLNKDLSVSKRQTTTVIYHSEITKLLKKAEPSESSLESSK